MGPNKDATNIDLEIQEAEEFLSEEQISLIKSIVEGEANASAKSAEETPTTSSMWNASALRPSLRSLGLGRDSTDTRSDVPDEDEADEVDEDEDENVVDKDIKENESQSVANGDEIILGEVNEKEDNLKENGKEKKVFEKYQIFLFFLKIFKIIFYNKASVKLLRFLKYC